MTALDAGIGALDGGTFVAPIGKPRAAAPRTGLALVPRVEPALESRRLWERRYGRRLLLTDTAVVFASVASAAMLTLATGGAAASTWLGAAGTALVWLGALALGHTRAGDITGSGAREYKRVAHAAGYVFVALSVLFLVFQWQALRLELLVAMPVGLVALLFGRWRWRKWLMAERVEGHYTKRAIITGTRDDVEYVLRTLDGDGTLGYSVIGAATADGGRQDITVNGATYDVLGGMDRVASQARALGADTIIVANRPENDPDYIKRLSWELEGTAAELIISSRIADVAGPRISLRPIDGLPLIHVKIPEFEGGRHSLKRAMDIVVAAVALIPITLLVMPVVALLIKLDDGGPVFFRQTRIGRDGREFGILKFRTMRIDAEEQLAKLQALNEGNGLLFKMKEDPRITRIGGFLRKYSLDELPQFWNVLMGDMSVVGPRPPLPKEVREYDGKVYRRLFIKPGITGLWQISGRSDLSWEESVRLDLRYVENWSVMSDLMIMWRTAKVMVAPSGAGAY